VTERKRLEDYAEDIYTCNRTRCGFCREQCPVYHVMAYETYSCRGKMLVGRGLMEKTLSPSAEMAQILEPFISGSNQLLRVDSGRNLLILAGNAGDMARLLDTIEVFDVDRMTGMSVALFTPDFVDVNTLANDLEAVLNDPQHGLMAGLVRFVVIERLNGLMVVAPRAEHLARVREWIQRLDRDTADASPRLFIYRVQNGKATELADVLSQIFAPEAAVPAPSLAPGLTVASPSSQSSARA